MRAMMGTNFYWLPPNPLIRPIHLGKSSAGWCFALHVYAFGLPDMDAEELVKYPAKDWDDWKELLAVKNSFIRNEYGELLTIEKMCNIVECRAWTSKAGILDEQWHNANGSIPGPHGLSRHAIGEFCIAHGYGTWDCCVGDFS